VSHNTEELCRRTPENKSYILYLYTMLLAMPLVCKAEMKALI